MASKLDLVPSLKSDATGEGSVRRRVTLRDALVVTQLALSLVLLVAGRSSRAACSPPAARTSATTPGPSRTSTSTCR
jgi:hypothetical protein